MMRSGLWMAAVICGLTMAASGQALTLPPDFQAVLDKRIDDLKNRSKFPANALMLFVLSNGHDDRPRVVGEVMMTDLTSGKVSRQEPGDRRTVAYEGRLKRRGDLLEIAGKVTVTKQTNAQDLPKISQFDVEQVIPPNAVSVAASSDAQVGSQTLARFIVFVWIRQ